MSSQHAIRERVTNTIIEALQAGISPWHMPWSPARNTGFPRNAVTKRRFSGVNPLLLQLVALERGFQSKCWGSADQWASLGGQVIGCGTRIVLRERITRVGRDAHGERRSRTAMRLREHVFFHAEQVEGVSQFRVQMPTVAVQPSFQRAEKIIAATGADIREVEADKAWYFYPPKDHIEIPSKLDFLINMGGVEAWYDTVFHELFHFTEPRLGWDGGYELNEMRAEMGAGFLSATIGIPSYGPTKHHFNHVDVWVSALRQDHRAIFRVASAASAAVNFILACSRVEQVPA